MRGLGAGSGSAADEREVLGVVGLAVLAVMRECGGVYQNTYHFLCQHRSGLRREASEGRRPGEPRSLSDARGREDQQARSSSNQRGILSPALPGTGDKTSAVSTTAHIPFRQSYTKGGTKAL